MRGAYNVKHNQKHITISIGMFIILDSTNSDDNR